MNAAKCMSAGFLSAVVSTLLGVMTFLVWMQVQGAHVELIGAERNAVYIIPIVIASMVANVVGAFVFFMIGRSSSRPKVVYTWIVIIVTISSSVVSQNVLQSEYTSVAHTLHLIVAGCSLFFLFRTDLS